MFGKLYINFYVNRIERDVGFLGNVGLFGKLLLVVDFLDDLEMESDNELICLGVNFFKCFLILLKVL